MDHYFNNQFAQQLRRFFDAAPGEIKPQAGWMNDKDYKEFYRNTRSLDSGMGELIGKPGNSVFQRGKGSVLSYADDKTKAWAIANGPKYGVSVDPDNPWFVQALGERQKSRSVKTVGARDLIEAAYGSLYYSKEGGKLPTRTSPEKQRRRQPPQRPPSKEFSSLDEAAQAKIQESEGYRNTVYLDTTGNATVGYGHKVLPGDNLSVGDTVTDEQAAAFFETDYAEHAAGASALSNWDELSDNLRSGLIDFAFNIGRNVFGNETGEAAWPTMMAALEAGDFDAAADEVVKDWDNVGEGRRNALVDLLMSEGL
jgi:lysozyme